MYRMYTYACITCDNRRAVTVTVTSLSLQYSCHSRSQSHDFNNLDTRYIRQEKAFRPDDRDRYDMYVLYYIIKKKLEWRSSM